MHKKTAQKFIYININKMNSVIVITILIIVIVLAMMYTPEKFALTPAFIDLATYSRLY